MTILEADNGKAAVAILVLKAVGRALTFRSPLPRNAPEREGLWALISGTVLLVGSGAYLRATGTGMSLAEALLSLFSIPVLTWLAGALALDQLFRRRHVFITAVFIAAVVLAALEGIDRGSRALGTVVDPVSALDVQECRISAVSTPSCDLQRLEFSVRAMQRLVRFYDIKAHGCADSAASVCERDHQHWVAALPLDEQAELRALSDSVDASLRHELSIGEALRELTTHTGLMISYGIISFSVVWLTVSQFVSLLAVIGVGRGSLFAVGTFFVCYCGVAVPFSFTVDPRGLIKVDVGSFAYAGGPAEWAREDLRVLMRERNQLRARLCLEDEDACVNDFYSAYDCDYYGDCFGAMIYEPIYVSGVRDATGAAPVGGTLLGETPGSEVQVFIIETPLAMRVHVVAQQPWHPAVGIDANGDGMVSETERFQPAWPSLAPQTTDQQRLVFTTTFSKEQTESDSALFGVYTIDADGRRLPDIVGTYTFRYRDPALTMND